MSESDLDPLPPRVVELLEAEREQYPEDPALKSEIFSRVELSVTLAAGDLALRTLGIEDVAPPLDVAGPAATGKAVASAATATTAAAGSAKLISVALATFVVGAGAGSALTSLERADSSAMPKPHTSMSVPVTSSSAPPREVFAPVLAPTGEGTVVADPLPSSSASARVAHSPANQPAGLGGIASDSNAPSTLRRGDLDREREILDAAHAALSRGRAADAMAAAARHAREWPGGHLGEERDAVLIQALIASGRRDEALARAAQFRKTYPSSMLLRGIEAKLSSAGSDAGVKQIDSNL